MLIPEAYVPDLDVRLGLYRRLSWLERKVELEGFAAELIDRFGPMPPEVETLLLVVRIKALCKRAGIARLDGGPKGATVAVPQRQVREPGRPRAVPERPARGRPRIKDNRIVIRREWAEEKARLVGAFGIARDLAALAQAGGGRRRRRA